MRVPSLPRGFVVLFVSLLLLVGSICAQTSPETGAPASSAPARPAEKSDPDRDHAHELFASGKFVDAMPLLEKLAADRTSDAAVKEWWAFSMMAYASTLSDPELRKKARARARKIGFEAKQLGDNSNLLQVVLEVPDDGAESAFSNRKDVDDATKAAEATFPPAALDKPPHAYPQALLLDPGNYEAALFISDVYFNKQ